MPPHISQIWCLKYPWQMQAAVMWFFIERNEYTGSGGCWPRCLNELKWRCPCFHRFKYVLRHTHTHISPVLLSVSAGSLRKASTNAAFWNKDSESSKVSSWRILKHQSPYFHPEYKWLLSGFLPLFCLSSVSHVSSSVSFSVSSSQTTAKHPQFYSGTERHTSPTFKSSVLLSDILVVATAGSSHFHTKLRNPKSLFAAPHYEEDYYF